MPNYSVWYRDNEEPFEFVTAYRCQDVQILEHVLAHENITPPPATDTPASVRDIIAQNKLGQVRYTEDESEMTVLG